MKCKCVFCKNNLPFNLPQEIIDETISGNLVLFVGAGVSTESKSVFKETLYEEVFADLKLNPNENIDFPSLMSRFCKQKNGRKLLLEKIRKRFDYCYQYIELYNESTRFHSEISSIYFLDKIITTNWDDYFERECNAIPIVTPEDFAFYNINSRKVFKIHGSISNYGSIIASNEDYNICYKNLQKGLIGGHLKTLLATKTVLFVGFSFKDYDFNRIYNYLKKEMKSVIPHCYVVTIDESSNNNFNNENVTVINTDGTYFFSILRKHLEGSNYLIPKENLDNVYIQKHLCTLAHGLSSDYFFEHKTISSIYNLCYQDGLIHAFDYLIFHSNSGQSFNPYKIISSIESYEKIKKGYLKNKNYVDFAYIEGYIIGLHSILLDNIKKDLPYYYIIGIGPIATEKQFKKLLIKNKIYHVSADRFGAKHFKNYLDKNVDAVPHHRPFI